MIIWVAAAVLVAVIAAAIHRPTLFRIGWRYMRSNPKQFAVAVAGLMVGMAVMVATGITADSAAVELERQLAEQRGDTDLLLRFRATPVDEASAWFDGDIASSIQAHGLAYRARQTAVDPVDGVGLSDVAVIGIEERYPSAVTWLELDGKVGRDMEGVALTRSLATALDVGVGDEVRYYLPPVDVQGPDYTWARYQPTFNGTMVAAAQGPAGPVHSDEDVHEFTLEVPAYATYLYVYLNPAAPSTGDWTVVATDPGGTIHERTDAGVSSIEMYAPPFAYLPAGEWTLTVHAEHAADTDFQVAVDVEYLAHVEGSPAGPPPPLPDTWYTLADYFDGHIVAATNGADGPTHSDDDVYAFEVPIPVNTSVLTIDMTTDDSPRAGWTMVVTSPSGEVEEIYMSGPPDVGSWPEFRIESSLEDPVEPGTWIVEVHPDAAVDETFDVKTRAQAFVENPDFVQQVPQAVPVVRKVDAVLADAADPQGAGIAMFVPLEVAQEIDGTEDVVSEAVLRLDDEANVPDVLRQITSRAGSDAGVLGQDLRSGPRAAADELRAQMSEVWAFMGGFTVAASLLLVFVLMALLVDERRPILATMRAMGGQRADLTRMQVFEAFGYGLAAALVGALAGLGLALVLQAQVQDLWASGRVVVDPMGVLGSLLVGLMLLILFAAVAAHRASGLHVSSALRGEDAAPAGVWWLRIAAGVVLAGLGVFATLLMAGGDPVFVTLGPSLLIIAAGMFLSARLSRHVVFPAVGGGLLVWLALSYGVLADIDSAAEALLLPARALTFCTAAALLFVYSRHVHAGLGWLVGHVPGGVAFESAMAQVRGRPGRATFTVLLLGMVILSVSFMQAVVAADGNERWRDLGDFDVIATTQHPLQDAQEWLDEHPPSNGVDPMANAERWADTPWSPRMPWLRWDGDQVSTRDGYGVTEALIEADALQTMEGPPAAEAFRQVLEDPGKVVVAADVIGSRGDRPGVGDRLSYDRPEGGGIDLTIVAVLDARWHASVFVHPDTLVGLVDGDIDPRLTPGRAILAVAADGVAPERVGQEIAAGFREVGMASETTGSPEGEAANASLTGLLQVFVTLALAVGAVSLGLVAARNVISRRREIGMIRSVGAPRRVVVGMVLAETLYLVAVAVTIGLVGTWMTLAGIGEDALRFDMQGGLLLGLYTLALGSIAAAVPAWSAARLDPARAVRHSE